MILVYNILFKTTYFSHQVESNKATVRYVTGKYNAVNKILANFYYKHHNHRQYRLSLYYSKQYYNDDFRQDEYKNTFSKYGPGDYWVNLRITIKSGFKVHISTAWWIMFSYKLKFWE